VVTLLGKTLGTREGYLISNSFKKKTLYQNDAKLPLLFGVDYLT
jgi:hypothetical protein